MTYIRDALFRALIMLAYRRVGYWGRQRVVSWADGIFGFYRFAFLWPDEYVTAAGTHYNRPPWWRPFNALLHCWRPAAGYFEEMHDHPRWSITVCLRGQLLERTPWGDRLLTAGSVVVRTRKAIHGFTVPDNHRGKTWTLFIVGRRNHPQNTFIVTPRGQSRKGAAR